jgi:hypothetical protein
MRYVNTETGEIIDLTPYGHQQQPMLTALPAKPVRRKRRRLNLLNMAIVELGPILGACILVWSLLTFAK